MKRLPLFRSWFYQFAAYNFVFLSLQFIFILSQSSSFIETLPLPKAAYLEIAATGLVHITLYLLLSLVQSILLWGLYTIKISNLARGHLGIWMITTLAIISTNGHFFPLSNFSRVLLSPFPRLLIDSFMGVSLLLIIGLLINALLMYAYHFPRAAGITVISGLMAALYVIIPPPHITMNTTQPSIILIGIDSLSPRHVTPTTTPTIQSFIHNSVYFKESITPLARTNPSWQSILSGLYPYHHQGRYNLIEPRLINHEANFTWLLQQHGYETVFATDDRRFNALDESDGFQRVIGPKLGINDILLGTFNDFPLSNLLVNFPISHWLFPYNYINRASHFSYYPQSFNKALQKALTSRDKKIPLFLAVHFTLPHWPYAFARSGVARVTDEYNFKEQAALHQAALRVVDTQVNALLMSLKNEGYLQHSLVLLLSDHGETLYEKGSRQTLKNRYAEKSQSPLADYFKRKTSTVLERSAGHGSDLLSMDQFHCVMAAQLYEHNLRVSVPATISERVALIDIAPTILAYLGLPKQPHHDGIALMNPLRGKELPAKNRPFILESGMFPNQFFTRDEARRMGTRYFTVIPQTSRLQLRPDALPKLDAIKLYGIIQGNWEMALYPDDNGYIPVIIDLTSYHWVDTLQSDFAKASPANAFLHQLERFYQKKFTLVQ